MIQHPVKFPKSDHSKHADQQPKQDLVSGEHDQQRDCPKRDRADEPQNKSGTRGNHVRSGLLKSHGHHLHHSQGTKQAQAQISEYERMERVVFNALAKEMRFALVF